MIRAATLPRFWRAALAARRPLCVSTSTDVRDNARINEQGVLAHLEDKLQMPLAGATVQQFLHGQSNPTYVVDAGDAGKLVLRKQPAGERAKDSESFSSPWSSLLCGRFLYSSTSNKPQSPCCVCVFEPAGSRHCNCSKSGKAALTVGVWINIIYGSSLFTVGRTEEHVQQPPPISTCQKFSGSSGDSGGGKRGGI